MTRTKIGTILNAGDPIPPDVTGILDRESSAWIRTKAGHWHLNSETIARCETGAICTDSAEAMRCYAPLTVVSVRGFIPRLARVNDVIEHGQDIPANVVEMTGDDGDPWRRGPDGWTCRNRHDRMPYKALTDVDMSRVLEYAPLTVVEVDPKPQPAGPVVLTLPEVPAEAVALIGNKTTKRYTPFGVYWEWGNGDRYPLVRVLATEHPDGVTVEFAAPREPRTWSHIGDGAVEGGYLPDTVSVRREVWHRDRLGLYRRDVTTPALSLLELRTLGKVTEVLEP